MFAFLQPKREEGAGGLDAGRDTQHNACKWDLLSSMGVFTLHASNIKGKKF